MDIIAAISTPAVRSAIGIIRLSGDGCLQFAEQFFKPVGKTPLSLTNGNTMRYGKLYNLKGEIVDECLAAVFRAPGSYTGEDSLEFQCHGSPVLLASVLQDLLTAGARQAEPGEYTKRAFLNGKMDLIQTEAVIDLIDAETPSTVANAAAQLEGSLSRNITDIYDTLTFTEAHFQAVVDYPDEDLDPFDEQKFLQQMKDSSARLKRIAATYERGKVLKEGISCALLGKPNAGKSSLFNALMGYDRTIVTDIPGTTRDTISEKVILGGLPVNLIDTAGVRESTEIVEKMGVDRSLKAINDAQLVLMIVDGSEPLDDEVKELLALAQNKEHLILLNKTDLNPVTTADDLLSYGTVIPVSAKDGTGLDLLETEIKSRFSAADAKQDQVLLTNARQASAVLQAAEALQHGIDGLENGLTQDVVLLDVENALKALGEILGRSAPADMLETLFSRFCVGK